MEEENYFDIAYEGTIVSDCIRARKYLGNKVLVYDNNGTYGSTYTNIDHLKKSKYIKNFKLNKFSENKVYIEAMPQIVRQNDEIFKNLNDLSIASMVEFVKVDNYFFIDKENVIFKIPCSKAQIASCIYLNLKEKRLVCKTFEGKMNIDELFNNIEEKNKELFCKTICNNECTNAIMFNRFISNFENSPFVYPLYGMKEISEIISRCNAVNGISYIIDPSVQIEKTQEFLENKPINYIIKSKYEDVYVDKIIFNDKKCVHDKFYRVLLIKEVFIKERFVGVFDGNEIIYCIALDSTAKVCESGTYLLYFWKYESSISYDDLKRIGINYETVLIDLEFKNNIDFEWDVIC